MAEIKRLPNGGTQKGQKDFLMALISAGWVMTIIALKMDWLTLEEIQVVGVTFDRWWVAASVFGGIYALGEYGRKRADSNMNQNA